MTSIETNGFRTKGYLRTALPETQKSSIIFCSQYEFEEWYDQLGGDDSPLAGAIIDSIAHDSYRINITSIIPNMTPRRVRFIA